MHPRMKNAFVVLAVATTAASVASADVGRQLDDFALFASERIRTRGLHVLAGDVGVDEGSFETRGAVTAPASTVAADVVRVGPGSTCAGLLTSFVERDAPACTLTGGFPGPFFDDLSATCGIPPSPPPCNPQHNVAVPDGQASLGLPPGAYGNVTVAGGASGGGTLGLRGGQYVFCSVRLGPHARLRTDSAAQVFVAGDLTVGSGGQVGGDLDVTVGGARVGFARGAGVTARVCAPKALFTVADDARLDGRFAARSIRTGRITVKGLATGPTTTTSTSTSTSSTSSTASTSTSLPPTTSTTSTSLPPTTSTTSTSSTVTTTTSSSTSSTSSSTTTSTSTTSTTAATIPLTTTSTTSTTSTSTSTTSTVPTTTTTTAPAPSTTTTSTSTTTTTIGSSLCGNGHVDPGETCDDGNTKDGDACPSNCRIESCTPVAGSKRSFTVTFTAQGQEVSGITVLLDYPEGQVSIPGTGADTNVRASITGLPSGTFGTPNDLDYELREVVASLSTIPAGSLFTVGFQDCQGAQPPDAGAFKCTIQDAVDSFGLPVVGVTCAVQAN